MITPTESSAAVGDRLRAIAAELEFWIEFDLVQLRTKGLPAPDDTRLICPPSLPSIRLVRGWIGDLETAAALSTNPSVPAGDGGDWVTVPREPTEAMVNANLPLDPTLSEDFNNFRRMQGRQVWAAMVAAAQRPAPAQAPETAGGDLEELRRLQSAMRSAESLYRLGSASYAGMASAENAFNTAAIAYVRNLLATSSAAPDGSDRERVATPEPRGWAFDYRHAHGEWVSMACKERPKEGPDRRNIRPLYEAAALTPQPASPGAVERVRHVKRGTEYEVLGEAEAQVSEGMRRYGMAGAIRLIRDDDRLTIYRALSDGKLWCRFTDEFRDGRFVTVAPAEPTPPTGPDAAEAVGEDIQAALHNCAEAVAFFDQVKAASKAEQIAVGSDHWNWLEKACRRAAALAALPAASGAGEDADAGVGS